MKKGVLLFLLVGILSLAVCYGDVVNISYIHEHFEDLKGKEVNVTGVVTAKFKNNLNSNSGQNSRYLVMEQ